MLKEYSLDNMDSFIVSRWNFIDIINKFINKEYNTLHTELFNVVAYANNINDNFTKIAIHMAKELGLTIVIIAHQMSVIERVCNKVAILSDHKIVEMGSVVEVFMNPKTEAAKNLVYSGHVMTKLHQSKLIRLEFNGDTDTPIVANIIQDCNMLVSIVYANSWVVDDKVFGQLIIKLPYYKEDIERLKNYLKIKGISYQEVNDDELGKFTGSDS